MRTLIADASCLILFDKIGALPVLKGTLKQVITTDKVITEFGQSPEWVTVVSAYDISVYEKLRKRFGTGESSCIALAQRATNPLLIIDDRKARSIAENIGIECVGSLGVLLLAKREGVIDQVKPILTRIDETNFHLTQSLIDRVLQLAGE